MMQKTISREVSFEGVGVHFGQRAKVILRPADTNRGIFFKKVGSDPIFLYDKNLKIECDRGTNLVRRLTLDVSVPEIKIMTVEHFLSAVYMMGIVNLEVAIEGEEIPALEGNALCLKKILDKAGVVEQDKELEIKKIEREITVTDGDKFIKVTALQHFPRYASLSGSGAGQAPILEITYTIDYPDTPIGKQTASFKINEKSFFKEIAPARTFCLEEEVKMLRSKGLALGGSLDNALVVYKDRYSSKLKFPNEPLRHKVLDIIGDLATTGQHFCAKIEAFKSGHGLNIKLVRELRKRSLA